MVNTRFLSVDPPDLSLWQTAKGLAHLWREQWRLVSIGLACAFVYSGLSLAIPIVVRHAIDSSIAPTNGHREPLWPYLVAVVALGLIRFGVNYTRRYATARTGIRVEARMRELLYDAYLRYPRAFYDQHATGQVVSRATNDLYPVRYFIGWGMTQGLQSLMMIFGIAVVLFFVNPTLALVALIAMPAVFLLAFTFARKVMPVSRQVQQLKANVTEAADEAVVGIEMVQAFGREDDVQQRFAVKAEAVRDGVLRQARIEAAFLPGLLFLPTLSIGAVLLFGGRQVIGGTLTYGEFFLFYQLLLQLVWPLEALGWILSLAQRATASASRSFAWLQGIEPVPEAPKPVALPAAGELAVRFEGVHFSYGSGSEVLSGVDLELAPGEVIAVCGPTGAGKTSLLNLLPRFYDPTEGRVLVGGIDIREFALAELRAAVAIVTQKPILFSIPLRDNLTAARPGRAVGRGRRGLRGCRRRPFRGRPPGGLRHTDRRAWSQPLGRAAPAGRARARAHRRRTRRRARRPDVGCRHSDRAPSRREPPPRARGPHGADRHTASLDGGGRRSRGRPRRGRDRRIRDVDRTACPRRRLRSALR